MYTKDPKMIDPNIVLFSILSLAEMERNVYELESGNYDFDDSEIKQRYDNQRQLNVQLQEQKHWLEHELEEVKYRRKWSQFKEQSSNVHLQIKLKIQNDRSSFLPDPFMMDWDNLSETELKRLVVQYEKTKWAQIVSKVSENTSNLIEFIS